MGKFIVARHHESEWNKKGLWTGLTDVHLTEYGFTMSEEMGRMIKDIEIDRIYTSTLVRAIETADSMLKALDIKDLPTDRTAAINERDYGDYTGKNKWEVQKLIGVEEFDKLRREWNYPVPHGETLKMVYERVIPYFKETMLPKVLAGDNVLMVSHGNAIRALMKYIEKIPDEGVKNIEMLFGSIVIYDLDAEGYMLHKEVRVIPSQEKINA